MDTYNLRRVGNQIRVSLPTDENGYTGRECPDRECEGYFKILFGTGLADPTQCHCPYCGQSADQADFATRDQIEYAQSVAMRRITDAFVKDLTGLEFDIKPKDPFGIGLSMKVKSGPPHPIRYYREKALETQVVCANCRLHYAVYGVFAFCPDCRQHNSTQILDKNLEIVGKMLDLAESVQPDLAARLIENALEDCVSAFDGFGREICRVYAAKAAEPTKVEKVSFQNLEGARQAVRTMYGLDLDDGLEPDAWMNALRGFQKRHVLAHKMGVVDEEYIRKTGDLRAIAGRKLVIGADEVRELARILAHVARTMTDGLRRLP